MDGWQLHLDLDPGEIDGFHFASIWGASVSDDGEDLTFAPLDYNGVIAAGETMEFGFQVAVEDGAGVPWEAGDFFVI